MGQFTFETQRCPATNEPCVYLEGQLLDSQNPDYLRQTLGSACREGFRMAKMTLLEQVDCGLNHAEEAEQLRAAREKAKDTGAYYA